MWFQVRFTDRYRRESTLLYLGMGWIGVIAVGELLEVVGTEPVLWLLGGGFRSIPGTDSTRYLTHVVPPASRPTSGNREPCVPKIRPFGVTARLVRESPSTCGSNETACARMGRWRKSGRAGRPAGPTEVSCAAVAPLPDRPTASMTPLHARLLRMELHET